MRTAKRVISGIVVVMVLAMGGRSALAADRITLRADLRPGMSWTFSQSEMADMSSSYKANGQQQKMQQKIDRKISGKTEVVEAANGMPTAVRITFDRECGGTMEGNGQKQPMPFSLAGKTVNVKLTANGQVTHDAGQIPPPDVQVLQGLAQGDETFLPTQPIGIGESWSPDMKMLAEKWQLDPQKNKIAMQMTLRDVKQAGPDTLAIVDFTADMSGEAEGGMTGSRKMSGMVLVDARSGKILMVDSKGTMSMNGVQQQQGQDGNTYVIEMSSEGTIVSRSEAHFPDTRGGAGADAPGGVNDGPSPRPVPAPPLRGNDPPVAGPGNASAEGIFAFRDQNMSLTFTSDPRAPGITGKISMGGQEFPVKVTRWDGTNLAGSFESDGNSFDFTGRLDHDTLNFKTGNTEYQLKAAPQQKKNPLEK